MNASFAIPSARRAPQTMATRTAAVLLATLAGCTVVGSDYEPPASPAPATWSAPAEAGLHAEPPALAGWWQRLNDPVLDGLVERAVVENHDVRQALERVTEARALRGAAAGERWPELDGTAAFSRRHESENTPLGAFVPDTSIVSTGFDAAWELDVWGRVRRSVEAADADLQAGVEDARDVSISVAAETARAYVELRTFQLRVELARRNVSLQEETLALVQSRLDAGLVGERDVAQAASNLATTRSRVPPLEAGALAAWNRLAVLTGVAPGALDAELEAARAIPVPPLEVAVGVPADLLRARADVRRAERRLAAEHARIGVAEGDRYPRLTLAGNLGLAAEDLDRLFDAESRTFGLMPSLRWNLFDGERARSRVRAQESRAEQARLRWEQTVLVALEESENAMSDFVREQVRRRSLGEATDETRRSVELARTQYREGLSDFQAVLDSERALAALEDELAQSDAAIATSFVGLCKALGGGWAPEANGAGEALVDPVQGG